MNGIFVESTKFLSSRAVQFVPEETYPSVGEKKNALEQDSSVPLYFHCLGGNWEGQIQYSNGTILELRIQGMPPVQEGQILQFQCLGELSNSDPQLHTGHIQRIQVQEGTTVWERTTILLVKPQNLKNAPNPFPDSPNGFSPWALGSIVICQVIDAGVDESYEMEKQVDASLPLRLSTTKSLMLGSDREYQKILHIKSSRVSLHNKFGQKIVAYHDYPTHTDCSTLPVVVLAPGYGETKRDYLTLAYYFASNGFHVIRYDHTHHVGESQGTHFDTSLSSMKHDFQSVVQSVHQQWPQGPVIGVASSLSARVALKAEAEDPGLALLVLLVGIVDVQQSVATVHQEDVFANYLNGQIQESANILGFNVGQQFLRDAVTNKFSSLGTTLDDVNALVTPVMYISAGKDAWIEKSSLEFFKQGINSQLINWLDVPEALHRLQENPKLARSTYRHIIQHCRKHVGLASPNETIHEPNRGDLGKQNRQEKFALHQEVPTTMGQPFWSDYLCNFQTVGTCQDYVQLLDHVFHALGPIAPGQRFLDAGCGNGNVGLYFLQSLQQNPPTPCLVSDGPPIRYIGIDIVKEALGRAQAQMTKANHSREKACPSPCSPVQMSWSQIDLQHSLPFADHQFDRIVSNLVVGYVADPQLVLRELYRVLAPGGRMVLSNLKPHGDFSGIYHNLVNDAGHSDKKNEARELLNNYGKIRQAEKEGQFRFFDHTEWRKALAPLNCVYAEVYPTFANQAYLIVLEKPELSLQDSLSSTQNSHRLVRPVSQGPTIFKHAA